MTFINKAIIQGNLGSDPVMKPKKGGKFVIFSVATEVEYSDKNGVQRKFVEWHNVAVFDDFLTLLARGNFKKGDLIRVEGTLSTTSWEGADGKTNYRTQIVVRNSKIHKLEKIKLP
ncbi:MAG: single-strand DNA-binding protein [Rickettsiales bacterium]|jgi:single-strand DNA-binding protein